MRHRSLFVALLFLPFAIVPTRSFAADWQQPTPEELKMTSEPAAPNADAIYLYREDVTDNKLHMESVYIRLKVLRDEGKKYADVEILGAGREFYTREYVVKQLQLDASRYEDLRKFSERIAYDEATSAVLKKK